MFKNIGRKIKTLAKVVCWLGIIFSVLLGVMIMLGSASAAQFVTQYEQSGTQIAISSGASIVLGIIVIVVGVLASWIGSFMTYGFGQLIENSEEIKKSLGK